MIFLEKKKKKKKKKTHCNSAAGGVQVFGKFVVVIEVNEREFFQRSSVYSWKCGKCKCERRENARAHFWRFQNFSFFFTTIDDLTVSSKRLFLPREITRASCCVCSRLLFTNSF